MSSSKRKAFGLPGAARAFLAAGCAASLAACVSPKGPEKSVGPTAQLPTEQFAVKVTNAPERIAIAVHADGLSANQRAALSDFVSRWRSDGGGRVTVSAPAASAAHPAAMLTRMVGAASAYLVQLGVPAELVHAAAYAAPAGDGPVLIAYQRFQAQGPDCNTPWDDLTATGKNVPYAHFGCAVTANIAAQVANPRDFLAPAVETPADDNRREVVLGKYRKGETTSTAKDDQADGKVSSSTGN